MSLNARAFFVIRINTKNNFILADLIYDDEMVFFSMIAVSLQFERFLLRVSMRNADRIKRCRHQIRY